MKNVSKILLSTALTATLVAPVLTVSASTASEKSKEVSNILNEKTDSPELWLKFIEDMKNDPTGRWLQDLIIKLDAEAPKGEVSVSTEETKEVVSLTYNTVLEGFDYGPFTSKVILKPSSALDSRTLDKDTFNVTSVSTYKDVDYATFTLAEKATDHETQREVTAVYPSDAEGNYDATGEYVALELAVHPANQGTTPFVYDILSGRNSIVPYYFNISLADGAEVLNDEGMGIELVPAGKGEKVGEIRPIADEFEHNQKYSFGDIDLQYASYVPETASSDEGSNPLIIWLHGAGEGGTDTNVVVLGNEVVNLATDDIQQYFGETGAYVLAPQSPTMWMDVDGTGVYNHSVEDSQGESYYTEALMGLIDTYVKANPEIDTNRIYIGGCSNGGYMTVNMIMEYPEYFAAAYPICEAYQVKWFTEEKLEAIKDTPIWLTHALTDMVVQVANGEKEGMNIRPTIKEDGNFDLIDDYSNALYDRLVEKGATNIHYSLFDSVIDTSGEYFNEDGTPYEYMGHFSWIYALNNESTDIIDGEDVTLFDWLSQQSK